MHEPDEVTEAVAALSRFFVGEGTLADTLRRVAVLACEAIGPADMAGITMLVNDRPCTAVFTDDESPEMDAAQYRNGSGPCLDAFHNNEAYRIESTMTDERWPEFARAAAAHGVVSTVSLPLVAHQHAGCALNLYARTRSFSVGDEALAASSRPRRRSRLSNAQSYWDARQLGESLTEAMLSRAVIEQAKGILMGAGGLTADEAFTTLSTPPNGRIASCATSRNGDADRASAGGPGSRPRARLAPGDRRVDPRPDR